MSSTSNYRGSDRFYRTNSLAHGRFITAARKPEAAAPATILQIRSGHCGAHHWMWRRRKSSVGERLGCYCRCGFPRMSDSPVRGNNPVPRPAQSFSSALLAPGEDRAKIERRQRATGSGVRADCGHLLGTCFLIPRFLNSPSFLLSSPLTSVIADQRPSKGCHTSFKA
jgi:hypothetical protein